jgi:hypothetical protein
MSDASLALCDAASIFPCSVKTLGSIIGLKYPAMPNGDDVKDMLPICSRTCQILTTTTIEYFEWLRTGVAGNWAITGASQSWNHWRHAHMTHKVLVHDDDDAIAAERRAMYTGRAEAWRWGRDKTAPIFEYDWSNAYPRIAEEEELPVRLLGSARTASAGQLPQLWSRYAVLADVSVTTDRPVVPTRDAGGILWPVGTFEATLWDPEIKALLNAGGSVTPSRVWIYERAPALRSWASWVLGSLHQDDAQRYRWLPIVLKHWSRSLIGRFAMQYQQWELFGRMPHHNIAMGTLVNRDTGDVFDTMQIGQDIHLLSGMTESDNSCPQITSYIMSACRAKLWNLTQLIGEQNVYYLDTDSVIVNTKGHKAISNNMGNPLCDGLRLKSRHRGYEIYGPRAIVAGGTAKFAGMPRGSQRTADDQWLGEVWSQLEHSVRIGEFDRVRITSRTFTTRWNDKRRARREDGTTTPYRLPGRQPATPAGVIPPVLERERIQYAVRALGAKRIVSK